MFNKIISKGITGCRQIGINTIGYVVDSFKEYAEIGQSIKADFSAAGEQLGYIYSPSDEMVLVEFPDSLLQELEDNFEPSPRKLTSPV